MECNCLSQPLIHSVLMKVVHSILIIDKHRCVVTPHEPSSIPANYILRAASCQSRHLQLQQRRVRAEQTHCVNPDTNRNLCGAADNLCGRVFSPSKVYLHSRLETRACVARSEKGAHTFCVTYVTQHKKSMRVQNSQYTICGQLNGWTRTGSVCSPTMVC